MMEISNKTLAWFVIGAIIISLTGSLVSMKSTNSITGYVTSNTSGEAKVDVSQSVVLRFMINSTDFGSGTIDTESGATNCTLAVDDTTTIYKSGCNGFLSNGNGPLTLENVGTSYLQVTLNFSGNASTFIGGNESIARLQFKVADLEPGSCSGVIPFPTWTEVEIPNSTVVACTNLSWSPDANSLRVGLNMTIPTDTVSGQKTLTIVAQGTLI
jgi:hypothetical protein